LPVGKQRVSGFFEHVRFRWNLIENNLLSVS
jgi:hypothetical protein